MNPYNSYTARSHTFTAGGQVPSASLNDAQDGIIGVSNNLDDLAARAAGGASGSANLSDAPAPDQGGAYSVWIEKSTDGMNVVVLDTTIDWRDRYIALTGVYTADVNIRPGGSSESNLNYDIETAPTTLLWFHYSGGGKDTTTSTSTSCIRFIPTADAVIIAARNSDGALVLYKSAAADPNITIMAEVRCSPIQNHH